MAEMCVAVILLLYISCSIDQVIGTDQWDYFTFAQEWPTAVCEQGKRDKHTCSISPEVDSWVIHGLWPTKVNTKGPFDCNMSRPFDFNKIKPLEADLLKLWPNMFKDTSSTSFWEHEWNKHGRCATSLRATRDEYMYFKQVLALMNTFSATKLLENMGILPSNSTLVTTFISDRKKVSCFVEIPRLKVKDGNKLAKVEFALNRMLGGKNAIIQCTKDENTGKNMLLEVEICLDKAFRPIDCYKSIMSEPEDNTVESHLLKYHKSQNKNMGNCPRGDKGIEYKPIRRK